MKERNLFLNGALYWTRVRNHGSIPIRLSTGTGDIKLARRIRDMHESMRDERKMWDLLDAVISRELTLLKLYNHYAAGTLAELRDARERDVSEPDVSPWVSRWQRDVLDARVSNNQITQQSADDYIRQVRAIIPEGVYFPASDFNEDNLGELITALPFSGSTKRRYVAALRLFYRYARKRIPLGANPFADAEWLPENNAARAMWWDHETRTKVLGKIEDAEFRTALTLMLGSGIELGALVAMKNRDVNADATVVAPGTKNVHRRDRTVFVDAWAWSRVLDWTIRRRAQDNDAAPLFPNIDADGGNLRDAFYVAQVAAGVIEAAPISPETRKPLWRSVRPHTLHDCRHTWTVCRLLGLDGEAKQDLKFCASNLGHATEQMVIQIYGKANIAERLRRSERSAA